MFEIRAIDPRKQKILGLARNWLLQYTVVIALKFVL
jgi:hypothetical protein